MTQTIGIWVSGKVQGVFFRQSTKEKAKVLGLTGVARNLDNGDVEIIATGSREHLDKLIEWCRTGPPKAVVADIKTKELPLQTFENFKVERG
jgi:acylphosphatase